MGQPIALVAILTLVICWADAVGFTHASQVWRDDQFVWSAALKSLAGFTIGIPLYWWVIQHLRQLGITAPELHAGGYFAVTLVLVALFSGQFVAWSWSDKLVGVAVLLGLTWLIVRVGG